MNVSLLTICQIIHFVDVSANAISTHKYNIFPEICKKVSKIDVFSPKWMSYSLQIVKIFI